MNFRFFLVGLAAILGCYFSSILAQQSDQHAGIVLSDEIILTAVAEARRSVETAVNDTIESLFSRDHASKSTHAKLVRLTRFPVVEARDVVLAAEVYEQALGIIQHHVVEGYAFNASEEFSYREHELSAQQLEIIARTSGCLNHRRTPNCSNNGFHVKYRTFDGTCNNLEHPLWGSSYATFKRLLKPVYENGFNLPIGWNASIRRNGFAPPSARLVSMELMSTKEVTPDGEFTHMLMQWGQFIDHDLDLAVPGMSSQSFSEFANCQSSCINSAPCFPIELPEGDARIKSHRCMEFIRNSAVCGSGASSILMNNIMSREQVNQLTSHIDASQVYGSTREEAKKLRDVESERGRLREGLGSLMPFHDPDSPVDCKSDRRQSDVECFLAGDVRANEQLGLLAMHTLWFREHNRIADELHRINPHWSSDTIYHEARKIVGAQMQFITYAHWLPQVLGDKGMALLGPYNGYDPQVDVTVSNVFATAAFRMGHGLIQPTVLRLNATYHPIPDGHLRLDEAFFSPWRLVKQGGIDPILRGLFFGPAKLKLNNQVLNSNLTENLFQAAHLVALDLAALNIQRGRDHGLPSYNEWRSFCGMTAAQSFDDLKGEIPDVVIRGKLRQLYGHPGNVDAWVGGMLEESVKGAKVGPTFLCLLAEQFRRLRSGDRFWYENSGIFSEGQLAQIQKTSLGRVICDNGDNIPEVSKDVFRLPQNRSHFAACDELPIVDLHSWRECPNGCPKIQTEFYDREEIGGTRQQVNLEESNDLILNSTAKILRNTRQNEIRQTTIHEVVDTPLCKQFQEFTYGKKLDQLEATILNIQATLKQMAQTLEEIGKKSRQN